MPRDQRRAGRLTALAQLDATPAWPTTTTRLDTVRRGTALLAGYDYDPAGNPPEIARAAAWSSCGSRTRARGAVGLYMSRRLK